MTALLRAACSENKSLHTYTHTTANTLYNLNIMPRIKTRCGPGLRTITPGLRKPVTRSFSDSQAIGYADYLRVRPNKLRALSQNQIEDDPYYQNGDCDDLRRGEGYEETDNDNDGSVPVVCHAVRTKRQRLPAAARQREAENRLKAEKRIVEILSQDGTSFTCQSGTKQTISVRHISTEGYIVKDIPMCPCGLSLSM